MEALERDVLQKLRARNAKEVDAFRELVDSLNSHVQDLRLRQRQLADCRVELETVKEEKASLSSALIAKEKASARSAEADSLAESVKLLQAELSACYKDNATVAQQLLAAKETMEHLRADASTNGARIQALEGQVADLRRQLDARTEEARALRAALDVAAEEAAASRAQANELSLRAAKLAQENEELTNRWMDLKRREAEGLNEANRIYDDVLGAAEKAQRQVESRLADAVEEEHRRRLAGAGGSGSLRAALLGGVMDDSDAATAAAATAGPPSRLLHTMRGHEGGGNSLQFFRTGTRLVSGGMDRCVRVWDPVSGQLLSTLQGALGSILDVAVTSDEHLVVGACSDKQLLVWSADSGRVHHILTGHTDKVCAVDTGGYESVTAVSGGQDRCMKVWDLSRGYCVQTIMCHSNCNGLATGGSAGLSTTLYSGHFDGHLRVWDTRSGRLTCEVADLHAGPVSAVEMSHDGTHVITCGRDSVIRLLDARTLEVKGGLQAGGFRFGANFGRVGASPTTRRVAAGSADRGVYVWDARSGGVEAVLKGHTGVVTACAWSPVHGSMMASCDRNGTVIVWR
eukprot:jgi/Mesvir1/14283/Mv09713-RA.1